MPIAWMNRPSAVRVSARYSSGAHRRRDEQRERQAEQEAVAEEEERRVVDGDDLAAGEQLRDAAAGHHQDQRRDDRLHADLGHQQAVPQAAQRSATPSAATIASHIGKRLTSSARRR